MSDKRRTVARWTTADIRPAEHGGFVCYGNYLTLERQNAELLAALKEVCAVLESETQAIVDTLWVSGGRPETLLDHCREAIRRAEG